MCPVSSGYIPVLLPLSPANQVAEPIGTTAVLQQWAAQNSGVRSYRSEAETRRFHLRLRSCPSRLARAS